MVILAACNRKPYVDHKLAYEKVADNCKEQQSYFRLTSNFGGERYEFEKCLPSTFTNAGITSERKGDTVFVNFIQPSGSGPNAVFHITLDIDSYPKYGFLTIDGDTYTITASQK